MDRPRQIPILQINIKPSRIACYYCVVVILLSWFAIGLADLSLSVHIFLCVIAAAYGWQAIKYLRTLPFFSLEYRNQNWYARIGDVLRAVELEKNIFVGAGMITVSFQLPTGKKIRVVLWPDSADAVSVRRLRAVLLARA